LYDLSLGDEERIFEMSSFTEPCSTAQIGGFRAGFALFENADDLLFGEAGFLQGETPGEPFWPGILYL